MHGIPYFSNASGVHCNNLRCKKRLPGHWSLSGPNHTYFSGFKKPPWLENQQDRKESEKLSENSTHEYTNSTGTNANLQDSPFGVVDFKG
ncbi:hypothetical protein CEXT_704381 [Caerostris extrusa]|uniref:Uncharacterized protein n=1 Tax=Caerostris extrusa TaxID=172846 RepID=A0AAV4T2W4_CAEEX|nr:hypothetical protein CEXT_704381 [Caerostris extrusa]